MDKKKYVWVVLYYDAYDTIDVLSICDSFKKASKMKNQLDAEADVGDSWVEKFEMNVDLKGCL